MLDKKCLKRGLRLVAEGNVTGLAHRIEMAIDMLDYEPGERYDFFVIIDSLSVLNGYVMAAVMTGHTELIPSWQLSSAMVSDIKNF